MPVVHHREGQAGAEQRPLDAQVALLGLDRDRQPDLERVGQRHAVAALEDGGDGALAGVLEVGARRLGAAGPGLGARGGVVVQPGGVLEQRVAGRVLAEIALDALDQPAQRGLVETPQPAQVLVASPHVAQDVAHVDGAARPPPPAQEPHGGSIP